MADYFTKFSIILSLPNEAAQKHALDLAHQATRIQQDDEPPGSFPASLAEVVEEWQFETDAEKSPDSWGLWLHSEYGGIEAVCTFIQYLLLTFDPESRLTFEWSHDCSKPRVDAYGGGAAIITAEEIQTIDPAPENWTGVKESFAVKPQNDDEEKTQHRADHTNHKRGRGQRINGRRRVSSAPDQRADLLPVASKVWRHGGQRGATLEIA